MLTQLFKLVFLHQMICEEAAKPESEIIWWSLRLLHISPTIYIFVTRSTLITLLLNLTMRSLGGDRTLHLILTFKIYISDSFCMGKFIIHSAFLFQVKLETHLIGCG